MVEKQNTKNTKKGAFTLAEVLITLVIIGVVASMVIPTLIDHVMKDMYAVGLKKSFSAFNQVLISMARDNSTDLRLSSLNEFSGSDAVLGSKIAQYFKISKNCGTGSGCFPDKMGTEFNANSSDAVTSSSVTGNHYSFITMDNMAYIVRSTGSGCTASFNGTSSANITKDLTKICGLVWVDVNGPKKPNNFGKDIFLFYIADGVKPTLYPAGAQDDSSLRWSNDGVNAINCTSSNPGGYTCAGRIFEQSWDVNY